MSSLYHSKVRSTQSKASLLFYVWKMDFSIISPGSDEAKVSTVNSDLTNFVDVECCMKILHEYL